MLGFDFSHLFDFTAFSSHVASGAVGAFCLWVLEIARRFLRNRALNRKYPIAGDYVAHTEDRKEGARRVFSSFVTLHQRGNKIEGIDVFRKGNKSWRLEASVIGAGHISGFYSAEAMENTGVGVFYLRSVGGDLDGFWAGWDDEIQGSNSGRYTYRRVRDIDIVPMENAHKTGILSIAGAQFGPGYLTEHDLDTDAKRDGARRMFVYVALADRKVTGFVVGEIADMVARYKIEAKVPNDIRRACERGTMGILRTIAVATEAQGHAVGERLFSAMERILHAQGAEIVAVPAWRTSRGTNIKGILDSNGYEFFLDAGRYWKEDCDRGEFKCGERKGECVCQLDWYKKALV